MDLICKQRASIDRRGMLGRMAEEAYQQKLNKGG
jgi:hypothetical protein